MTTVRGRVAVFGANGPTGRLLVRALLDRGHEATAITRDPSSFPIRHSGLSVVRADATAPAQVSAAIRGADAVASVIGTSYSRGPISLYSASATAMVAAMDEQGIRRLVVTSSMAATSWRDPGASALERFLVDRVLSRIGATLYEDMRSMEDIVRRSDLDWTIMRPLGLATMEPPTEYATARDHIGGAHTARQDLAAAIAEQLDGDGDVREAIAVATTNKSQSVGATIWREGVLPSLRRRGRR